jgi:hypothetical protein
MGINAAMVDAADDLAAGRGAMRRFRTHDHA